MIITLLNSRFYTWTNVSTKTEVHCRVLWNRQHTSHLLSLYFNKTWVKPIKTGTSWVLLRWFNVCCHLFEARRTQYRTLHHYTASTAPRPSMCSVFVLEFVLQIPRDAGATWKLLTCHMRFIIAFLVCYSQSKWIYPRLPVPLSHWQLNRTWLCWRESVKEWRNIQTRLPCWRQRQALFGLFTPTTILNYLSPVNVSIVVNN